MAHDHLDADGLIGGVPAVVVGRHADHRVAELRLARQLGFGQARHVDAGAGPGPVQLRFGARGELGAFYCGGRGGLVLRRGDDLEETVKDNGGGKGDGKGKGGELWRWWRVLGGREGRTHAYQRPALVELDVLALEDALPLHGVDDDGAEGVVERVREADVAHHAVLEIRPRPYL